MAPPSPQVTLTSVLPPLLLGPRSSGEEGRGGRVCVKEARGPEAAPFPGPAELPSN